MATATAEERALDNLLAVLCDPDGNPSINGSAEDLEIIGQALSVLSSYFNRIRSAEAELPERPSCLMSSTNWLSHDWLLAHQHVDALELALACANDRALRAEQLIGLAKEFDSASADAEWQPPHPIFALAQENDQLKQQLAEANKRMEQGYLCSNRVPLTEYNDLKSQLIAERERSAEFMKRTESVCDWLAASLTCKNFEWDFDQYEAARSCYDDVIQLIAKHKAGGAG